MRKRKDEKKNKKKKRGLRATKIVTNMRVSAEIGSARAA